jgi:hypothetical protein
MMILQKWHENASRVLQAGGVERAEARSEGVPTYFRDPVLGDGIVRESPDGSRDLIGAVSEEEIVRSAFGRGR